MASPTTNYDPLLISRYWDETFESGYSSTPIRVRFTAIRDRLTKESGLWISAKFPPKDLDIDIPGIGFLIEFWLEVKIEIISNLGTQSITTRISDNDGGKCILQQAQQNNNDGSANEMTVKITSIAKNETLNAGTLGYGAIPIKITTHTVSASEFPSDPGTPIISLESIHGYPQVGNYYSIYYYATERLSGYIENCTVHYNFNRFPMSFHDSNLDPDVKPIFTAIENPRLSINLDDGYHTENESAYLQTNVISPDSDTDTETRGLHYTCNQQYKVHITIKVDNGWNSCGVPGRSRQNFEVFAIDYIVPAAVQSITANSPEVILLSDPPQKVFYYLNKDKYALGDINSKAVIVSQTNPAVCSIVKNESTSTLEITPLAIGSSMITITANEYDKEPPPKISFEIWVSSSYEISQFKLPYDRLNVSLESKILSAFLILQNSYYHEVSYEEMTFNGYAHDVRTIYDLLRTMGRNIDRFAHRFVTDMQENDQYQILVTRIRIHNILEDYYVTRKNEPVSWYVGYENNPGVFVDSDDNRIEVPNWYAAINSIIDCLHIIGNVLAYPNSVVDGCYVDSAHVDREII